MSVDADRLPGFRLPGGRLLSKVGFRLAMLFSPRETDGGIELVDVLANRREALDRLQKVRDAVSLLRQSDAAVRPERFLDRIMVLDTLHGSLGWYWHDLRACFLDREYVDRTDLVDLAQTVVHEATHGRLRQRGIRVDSVNRD